MAEVRVENELRNGLKMEPKSDKMGQWGGQVMKAGWTSYESGVDKL